VPPQVPPVSVNRLLNGCSSQRF